MRNLIVKRCASSSSSGAGTWPASAEVQLKVVLLGLALHLTFVPHHPAAVHLAAVDVLCLCSDLCLNVLDLAHGQAS